jgi:hypothetical protein
MKCSNCDGVGTVEIMNCHDYSNECCGGCYITMMCDDCQGTGNVYSEDEDPEEEDLKNLWINLS